MNCCPTWRAGSTARAGARAYSRIHLFVRLDRDHTRHHPDGVSGHVVRNRSKDAGGDFSKSATSIIAQRLDKPMMIGFAMMLITGFLLYYAIPVRTTQSLWFRIKVVLLIVAGINAFLFRAKMQASSSGWDLDPIPPKRIRVGAMLSLVLWAGVVITGRTIAYDWFDCHKQAALCHVLGGGLCR